MSLGAHPVHPAFAPREAFVWAQRSARPVRLPLVIVLAIHMLVFSSLFSGLPGPAALGELRGEGGVIGVVAMIAAAALSGVIIDVRGWRSALVFLPLAVCIALSLAINAEAIADAHFAGRQGGEKFVTSLLVLGFYFSLFLTVSCAAWVYGARALLLCGSNAAVWCGLLMVGEMAVEIVSWFVPPVREAWRAARGLLVTDSAAMPMFRLVGFAAEPSLAAIAAMGLLGLLGSEAVIRGGAGDWPRSRARLVLSLIVALFALELFLANARTFLIGAMGAGLAWLLVSRFVRWAPAGLRSAVIVIMPLPVQAALMWLVLQQDASARSVSNISRSVGMFAATELSAQHPLFGVGLGQYGFHFRGVVPSWGMGSYEVSRFFREEQYDSVLRLPPSFSLFSRVAAELGLLGLAAWLLPTFLAIRGALLRRPGALSSVIVCALAAQLWVGLSLDSYRSIYYWFWLAVLLAWPGQREAPAPLPVASADRRGARRPAPERGAHAAG